MTDRCRFRSCWLAASAYPVQPQRVWLVCVPFEIQIYGAPSRHVCGTSSTKLYQALQPRWPSDPLALSARALLSTTRDLALIEGFLLIIPLKRLDTDFLQNDNVGERPHMLGGARARGR